MQSRKERLSKGVVAVTFLLAGCFIVLPYSFCKISSPISMGKTGKLSSEFQPAAPPKPQRSVLAPLLPPFSAAECKGAPFFTDLRIAGMIKAAQTWKETNDGQEEQHMNDNPHGVEHFDFLGALLDAAPSHAVKLLVDVGANQGGFTRFAALRGFAAIGFEALSRNAVYVRGKLQESKLNNHAIVVSAAMQRQRRQRPGSAEKRRANVCD